MKFLFVFGLFASIPALASAADIFEPNRLSDDNFEPTVGPLIFAAEAEVQTGYSFIDLPSVATDLDGSADDYLVIQGDVRASLPLAAMFAIQLDAGGFATNAGDRSFGNLHDYYYFAGHAAYRDPSRGALGIFGMYGDTYGGEDDGPDQRGEAWLGGIEAQYYWANVTVYGQAGFWNASETHHVGDWDVMDDAWFVRGQVRYFPDPMSRILGEVSYANGRESRDDTEGSCGFGCLDLQAVSWEVRYDRMLSQHVGLFAGYHGALVEHAGPANNNSNCCKSVTDHTLFAGLRFQLNAGDMLTMDRSGVTFSTPDLGRWLGYTTEVVDSGN